VEKEGYPKEKEDYPMEKEKMVLKMLQMKDRNVYTVVISLLKAVGMEEKIASYTLMMTEDSHCGSEMRKWIDIEVNKMTPHRTNQWSY
jgi:hypothetical protein